MDSQLRPVGKLSVEQRADTQHPVVDDFAGAQGGGSPPGVGRCAEAWTGAHGVDDAGAGRHMACRKQFKLTI